jgi:hypothetical protein
MSDEKREEFTHHFGKALYDSGFSHTRPKNMPLNPKKTSAVRAA